MLAGWLIDSFFSPLKLSSPAGSPRQGLSPSRVQFVHLGPYSGDLKRMVHDLKFGRHRQLARVLGYQLAERISCVGCVSELVTWVPASVRGRSTRGFDQSRALAMSVAEGLGVPCVGVFMRRGDGQTHKSRDQRMAGPEIDCVVDLHRLRRIVVVDDVRTTGASLRACTRSAHLAGVEEVIEAVICQT